MRIAVLDPREQSFPHLRIESLLADLAEERVARRRAALLAEVARIQEGELADPEAALASLMASYVEAPRSYLLADLERLGRMTGHWTTSEEIACYLRAILRNPTGEVAWQDIHAFYRRTGDVVALVETIATLEDPRRALARYEDWRLSRPDDAFVLEVLTRLHERKGTLSVGEERRAQLRRAGRIAWELGDVGRALELIERARACAESSGELVRDLVCIGLLRERLRDSQGAIAAYTLALGLEPNQPDACERLRELT